MNINNDWDKYLDHPPIDISVSSLNSKKLYKLVDRRACISGLKINGFILLYDLNLKILNDLNKKLKEFMHKNAYYFEIKNSKKTEMAQSIEAVKIVMPTFRTLIEMIDKYSLQFLFSFSNLFEDLCIAFKMQAQLEERESDFIKNLRNNIVNVETKNKTLDPMWVKKLNAATNYSRHFSEWNLIFLEIKNKYQIDTDQTSDKNATDWHRRNVFDRNKFNIIIDELINKSPKVKKRALDNIYLLCTYDEVAIEVARGGGISISKTIIENLKLNNFSRTIRRIKHLSLYLEKKFWESYR